MHLKRLDLINANVSKESAYPLGLHAVIKFELNNAFFQEGINGMLRNLE